MKKIYVKPIVELTACIHTTAPLMGSGDEWYHGEAKGFAGEEDDEDGPNPNNNLWDGWDD